jgi:hypothetical protein
MMHFIGRRYCCQTLHDFLPFGFWPRLQIRLRTLTEDSIFPLWQCGCLVSKGDAQARIEYPSTRSAGDEPPNQIDVSVRASTRKSMMDLLEDLQETIEELRLQCSPGMSFEMHAICASNERLQAYEVPLQVRCNHIIQFCFGAALMIFVCAGTWQCCYARSAKSIQPGKTAFKSSRSPRRHCVVARKRRCPTVSRPRW